jgi:hypothetical protein
MATSSAGTTQPIPRLPRRKAPDEPGQPDTGGTSLVPAATYRGSGAGCGMINAIARIQDALEGDRRRHQPASQGQAAGVG